MAARADIAMLANAIASLEAKIGALGAPKIDPEVTKVLSAVETKVDIFIGEFRDHRHTTETYRKDNIIVVAALNTAVQGLGANIAVANDKIEALAPVVASHVSRFAEQTGGLKVGRIIWVALGGSTLCAGLIGFLAAKMVN